MPASRGQLSFALCGQPALFGPPNLYIIDRKYVKIIQERGKIYLQFAVFAKSDCILLEKCYNHFIKWVTQ